MRSASSAILMAAFASVVASGCAPRGDTPTSPDLAAGGLSLGSSAAAGNGKRDTATYTVTVSGDISGGPETRQDDGDRQIVVSQPGITLDLSYFQTAIPGGEDCFASGSFTGSLDVHQDRKSPSSAETLFFFRGTGTGQDAGTEIKYQLTLDGTIHGDWPPAVGASSLVTGGTWTMQTEGRGKKRIGCTGTGPINYTIEVTRDS